MRVKEAKKTRGTPFYREKSGGGREKEERIDLYWVAMKQELKFSANTHTCTHQQACKPISLFAVKISHRLGMRENKDPCP